MNVNTAQVAQAKLEALIEAAVRAHHDILAVGYALSFEGERAWTPQLRSALEALSAAIAEARKPAALASPEDEGDVVERTGDFVNELLITGDYSPHEIALALARAGLLARPVDRDALAQRLATWRHTNGRPEGLAPYTPAPCDYEEADAILREVKR